MRSTDIIVIFILFVLVAAYGFYRSKGKLISLILSFYPAILLFLNFPYTNSLLIFNKTASQIFISKCIIFLIFLVPIHLILNRIISSTYDYGTSRLTQIAVLAICVLILILTFII